MVMSHIKSEIIGRLLMHEIYEMQKGAGMSESQTTAALQKLVGKNLENPHQERKRSGFYTRFHAIVDKLRRW